MKLYEIITKEIVDEYILSTPKGSMYADKLADNELISLGYKRVEYTNTPPVNSDSFKRVVEEIEEDLSVARVTYKLSNISLKEAKAIKLSQMADWANEMTHRCKIDLRGFGVIDGGYSYITNAEALINNYELLEKKFFRMWDDSFKEVSKSDLMRIKRAIEIAGIKIHELKWGYEDAIAKATSVSKVKEISFNDTIEVDLKDEQ